MKRLSIVALTLVAAAILWAAPVSLQRSHQNGLSLGLTLSMSTAHARPVHRVARRNVRRCAAGVVC